MWPLAVVLASTSLTLYFSDAVNCLIDGIDWTVTVGGGFCFNLFRHSQFTAAGSDIIELNARWLNQTEMSAFLLLTDEGQRLQIVIKHLPPFLSASFRKASYKLSKLYSLSLYPISSMRCFTARPEREVRFRPDLFRPIDSGVMIS